MTDQAAPSQRPEPVGPAPVGPAPAVPATLRWAVLLLAVQALALFALTGVFAYDEATRSVENSRVGAAVTVYFGLVAAMLAILAWFLHRRRAFARGPSVALEILLACVGGVMIQGGLVWLGVPVILVALTCAGLLLTPATRESLGIR